MIVTCPHCGIAMDAHEHIGPSHVTPDADNSASICWHCGGLSVFALSPLGVLTLRLPTAEEAAAIEAEPDVIAARRACDAHPDDVSAAVGATRLAHRERP